MLDDFRQQADFGFFDEEEPQPAPPRRERRARRHFLGLSPAQRFLVALLLLFLTILLSSFCLLVTERIIPPFI